MADICPLNQQYNMKCKSKTYRAVFDPVILCTTVVQQQQQQQQRWWNYNETSHMVMNETTARWSVSRTAAGIQSSLPAHRAGNWDNS